MEGLTSSEVPRFRSTLAEIRGQVGQGSGRSGKPDHKKACPLRVPDQIRLARFAYLTIWRSLLSYHMVRIT